MLMLSFLSIFFGTVAFFMRSVGGTNDNNMAIRRSPRAHKEDCVCCERPESR
jgi:hypothetical protein